MMTHSIPHNPSVPAQVNPPTQPVKLPPIPEWYHEGAQPTTAVLNNSSNICPNAQLAIRCSWRPLEGSAPANTSTSESILTPPASRRASLDEMGCPAGPSKGGSRLSSSTSIAGHAFDRPQLAETRVRATSSVRQARVSSIGPSLSGAGDRALAGRVVKDKTAKKDKEKLERKKLTNHTFVKQEIMRAQFLWTPFGRLYQNNSKGNRLQSNKHEIEEDFIDFYLVLSDRVNGWNRQVVRWRSEMAQEREARRMHVDSPFRARHFVRRAKRMMQAALLVWARDQQMVKNRAARFLLKREAV